MRATALLCGALVLGCAVAISAEAVKSGLQAGEGVPAFQVDDITGPNKGKQLCYVWANGNAPSILIFSRNLDGNLASLVKSSDEFISKHKGMKGFVVVVGEREKLQQQAKDLASKHKLSMPLTFFSDGPSGGQARRLKLSADAKHTVLIYTGKKVTSNFAMAEIKPEDIKAVISAAGKVAPKGGEGT